MFEAITSRFQLLLVFDRRFQLLASGFRPSLLRSKVNHWVCA